MTIRLADGKLVYINERSLAELYVKAQCDTGGVPSNGDCISQRLAVIEASLRVQHELAYDGKPLPCLHHAVQALRILNRASGEAKHGFADCRGHEPVFSPGSCSPPDLERNGSANSAPSADGSPLHDNATSDAAFPAVCGQDAPPPHDRDTSDDVHGATSEVEEAAGDMDDPFAMMSGMGSEQVYKVTLVAAVPAVSGHDGPPPHDKDTSDDVHGSARKKGRMKNGGKSHVSNFNTGSSQAAGRGFKSEPVQRDGGKSHHLERIQSLELKILSANSSEEEMTYIKMLQEFKKSELNAS